MLKKGSSGEEVKELQKFLGIPTDGVFGSRTERAVKEWQSKNRLVVDGIVGPTTRNRMGFISTDVNETVQKTKNGLVVHKHYLSEMNILKDQQKKNIYSYTIPLDGITRTTLLTIGVETIEVE